MEFPPAAEAPPMLDLWAWTPGGWVVGRLGIPCIDSVF